MAMSEEEKLEFTDTLKLLSAEELRGMKGDDDEQDALIDAILGGGKQAEVKGKDDVQPDEDEHPNPDDKRVDPPKPEAGDDDDGEDGDDDDEKPAPTEAPIAAPTEAPTQAPEAAPAVDIPKLDLSFLDADYKAKLTELDTEKAAKFKALMEGDLSAEDYATFESSYLAKREALRDDRVASTQWMTQVHNFRVQALQSDGVNYFDPKFNEALDDWVIRLANKGVPDSEVLAQAHKKVLAEFADELPAKGSKPTPAPTAAPAKPVNKNRAPDLSNIPPTLGGLPAAAGADPKNEGEFAHLDKLDGMAFETALARMTPDEQARYLAGQ